MSSIVNSCVISMNLLMLTVNTILTLVNMTSIVNGKVI
jgi:hypothetical protein